MAEFPILQEKSRKSARRLAYAVSRLPTGPMNPPYARHPPACEPDQEGGMTGIGGMFHPRPLTTQKHGGWPLPRLNSA
jgi:hypothetical protein